MNTEFITQKAKEHSGSILSGATTGGMASLAALWLFFPSKAEYQATKEHFDERLDALEAHWEEDWKRVNGLEYFRDDYSERCRCGRAGSSVEVRTTPGWDVWEIPAYTYSYITNQPAIETSDWKYGRDWFYDDDIRIDTTLSP